ncbi:hypothetical protein TNIN_176391 [Trichonephila inaurata madagascariensis]|uniref:Uncharacterized protein n=1 Tax=Trichonephila inaurata madagascariensis TaxID=2747483 RepID=A0A8X6WXD0_9ARAC|nr:hypothetical protein TNIN_176391 [Trichonephila inaurata madagascariensis]
MCEIEAAVILPLKIYECLKSGSQDEFSNLICLENGIARENHIMLVTSDELTYNIMNTQETGENIRNIKQLLPASKTSKFILNDNVLFKMSENQESLVVSEMMQVDVIKKAHSF